MLEKRGVIEEGRTPPETLADEDQTTEKQASDSAAHTSTRLSDAAHSELNERRS